MVRVISIVRERPVAQMPVDRPAARRRPAPVGAAPHQRDRLALVGHRPAALDRSARHRANPLWIRLGQRRGGRRRSPRQKRPQGPAPPPRRRQGLERDAPPGPKPLTTGRALNRRWRPASRRTPSPPGAVRSSPLPGKKPCLERSPPGCCCSKLSFSPAALPAKTVPRNTLHATRLLHKPLLGKEIPRSANAARSPPKNAAKRGKIPLACYEIFRESLVETFQKTTAGTLLHLAPLGTDLTYSAVCGLKAWIRWANAATRTAVRTAPADQSRLWSFQARAIFEVE